MLQFSLNKVFHIADEHAIDCKLEKSKNSTIFVYLHSIGLGFKIKVSPPANTITHQECAIIFHHPAHRRCIFIHIKKKQEELSWLYRRAQKEHVIFIRK